MFFPIADTSGRDVKLVVYAQALPTDECKIISREPVEAMKEPGDDDIDVSNTVQTLPDVDDAD